MKRLLSLTALACGFVSACGQSESGSHSLAMSPPSAAEAALDAVRPQATKSSLTWYFECPTEPGQSPPSTSDNPVIVGDTQHDFYREEMVGTPVTIHGRVCPPRQMQRDILFVIDVSGSMADNDTLDAPNKTCGRLKALQAVFAVLPTDVTNYGLATFGSTLSTHSNALFATKDALIATSNKHFARP